MLFKARHAQGANKVEAFEWAPTSGSQALEAASTPSPQQEAERQARLASAERDAFAKGYAQGGGDFSGPS